MSALRRFELVFVLKSASYLHNLPINYKYNYLAINDLYIENL